MQKFHYWLFFNMNYLTIYEDFENFGKKGYKEIPDYYPNVDSIKFDDKDLSEISSKFDIKYFNVQYFGRYNKLSISTNTNFFLKNLTTMDIFIFCYNDEYFSVSIYALHNQGVSSTHSLFYLCDQLSGLINLIDDLIENNWYIGNYKMNEDLLPVEDEFKKVDFFKLMNSDKSLNLGDTKKQIIEFTKNQIRQVRDILPNNMFLIMSKAFPDYQPKDSDNQYSMQIAIHYPPPHTPSLKLKDYLHITKYEDEYYCVFSSKYNCHYLCDQFDSLMNLLKDYISNH